MYIYDLPEFKIPKEFQDGLVGAWNGQQASDGSIVDLSGNGHNGTPNGGVILGRKNNTHFMQFDGSDDNVQLSDKIYNTTGVTKIAIFKFSGNTTDFYGIHYNHSSDDTYGADIAIRYGKLNISGNNGNGRQNTQHGPLLNDGKIHMGCVVFEGEGNNAPYKMYLDCNLIGSGNQDYNFSNSIKQTIGKNPNINTQFFPGYIYLVLTYNKDLSLKQIQKMYEYFRQWYHD